MNSCLVIISKSGNGEVAVGIAVPAPVDVNVAVGLHAVEDKGMPFVFGRAPVDQDRTAGLEVLPDECEHLGLVHIVPG